MKKWIILLVIVAAAISGVVAHLIFVGPEMTDQPNIRAYRAHMSLPPDGVVTVNPLASVPSSSETSAQVNPLSATKENIAHGKVYYGYYCLFCHGAIGDGNGPVGESFFPPPTDLRSSKVQNLKDGELLRAILTGAGHQPATTSPPQTPVLEYTVLPEHRWYLVLYLRSLGNGRDAETGVAHVK